MADNYLERKMEDLRSGKTQKPGSRRTSAAVSAASRHPGDYTLSYPELRVFVCGDATSPLGRAIVAALREVGLKVAFSGTDKQAGEEMARSLGAQFHPLADPTDNDRLALTAAYTLRHWRSIDAVVAIGFRPAFHTPSLRTITLLHPFAGRYSPSGRFCRPNCLPRPSPPLARCLPAPFHPRNLCRFCPLTYDFCRMT